MSTIRVLRRLTVLLTACLLFVVAMVAVSHPTAATGRQGGGGHPGSLDEVTTDPDFRQPHADLLRFYFAFFDRAPDPGGARYWIGRYDEGVELSAIAELMARSDEFAATYGGTRNDAFVEALYRNVLDRSSDPDGFRHWSNALGRSELTRGELARSFTASPEFVRKHRFVGEEHALPGPPPDRPTTVGRDGRIIRFSVEVEAGIGVDEDAVRAEVLRILGDRRSWIADGTVRFRTAAVDDADVRIRVASPATVDRRCQPLRTGGRLWATSLAMATGAAPDRAVSPQ